MESELQKYRDKDEATKKAKEKEEEQAKIAEQVSQAVSLSLTRAGIIVGGEPRQPPRRIHRLTRQIPGQPVEAP